MKTPSVQTVQVKPAQYNDPNLTIIKVDINHKVPSWKGFGDGHASVEFVVHSVRKFISIFSEEVSYGQGVDSKCTRKVTMVTIEADAARALYEELHKVFTQ